jgi:hypothetical protein
MRRGIAMAVSSGLVLGGAMARAGAATAATVRMPGPRNSTIGGCTLDIDTDIVDGPVAG